MLFKAFQCREVGFLVKIYKTYIRPVLEYNSPIWSPHSLILMKRLENVQRSFTRRIPGLSSLPYFQRLNCLKLDSLELRRMRRDLCEAYKIIHAKNDLKFEDFFTTIEADRTRGHNFRLRKPRYRLDVRKHYFSMRIISIWNWLPEEVVGSFSFQIFRNRLEKVDLTPFLSLNAFSY